MYTFFFRNCHWLVDHHFVYPWCVLCAYQISSETDSNFAGRGFLVAAAAWFIALCVHIDFMCCWATAACCCIYPRRAFRRPRWRPHLFFAPHTLQLFLLPVEEEKRGSTASASAAGRPMFPRSHSLYTALFSGSLSIHPSSSNSNNQHQV